MGSIVLSRASLWEVLADRYLLELSVLGECYRRSPFLSGQEEKKSLLQRAHTQREHREVSGCTRVLLWQW